MASKYLNSSSKTELNRRAKFAIRNANIFAVKKYHAEILAFELKNPHQGKVMAREDWQLLEIIVKKNSE